MVHQMAICQCGYHMFFTIPVCMVDHPMDMTKARPPWPFVQLPHLPLLPHFFASFPSALTPYLTPQASAQC